MKPGDHDTFYPGILMTDPNKAPKLMVFMKMKKFDIAALKRAVV
jgi:hypothetical protein